MQPAADPSPQKQPPELPPAPPAAGGLARRARRLAADLGVNRTVVALSFARLGDAIGNSILFILIPLYVARLPAPWFPLPEPVRVGILISLFGLVNAALQPVFGAVSDRIGRRKVLIQCGLVVMGLGTLAFVLATRFVDLLVLRSLQGLGVALTIPASMALMASATSQETRGSAMGVYTTLRMVGFAIGPLVGGFLQVRYGFEAAFYAGAGCIFVGLVLVQLWVHDPPGERAAARAAGAAAKAVEAAGGARRRFRVFDRDLLSAGILGAALSTFLMAGNFSMMTTLERQFNQRLHETALGFSVAFSALMVSRLLFQVPLGRLSDRIGRKPPIVAGLLLMAPATALLGAAATTFQLIGLRLVQGLAAAGIAAPAFALAGDVSREGGEGRQMGFLTMGFGLGIAVGPLAAGLLAVYSFELPFLVGGALSVAGAWLVLRFVPETVRRRSARSSPGVS